MDYFQSDEMFTKIISKYFTQKAPQYFKKIKVTKNKKKVKPAESKIILPKNLEEAVKFKRDYNKSFPLRYDAEFVEQIWGEWWENQKQQQQQQQQRLRQQRQQLASAAEATAIFQQQQGEQQLHQQQLQRRP